MAGVKSILRALVAVSLVGTAIFSTACSNTSQSGRFSKDKVAIINWQLAEKEHPDYAKLQQGEKILKDLLTRRESQERLAQTQLNSLAKLRGLRQVSKQNYLAADFNTRMYEAQQIENARLQKLSEQYAAQVEEQIGPRRRAIEDSYQLRIFNLRARLDNVRMKPDERKAAEAELERLQHERGAKVGEIQAQKQIMLANMMQPEIENSRANIEKVAADLQAKNRDAMAKDDERDDSLLKTAQPALAKALAIMDQEIDKQQEKNDSLRKDIADAIANEAVHIAKEKGYTIVFKQVKINVSADDITDDIVRNLKNKKDSK